MDHIDDTDFCDRCGAHHAALCPDDLTAVARVLMGGAEPCEGSLDDAAKVLLWARHDEGREVFARAMALEWVEGTVDPHPTRPHFPRGKHNGMRWHARRLVGDWENIPFCRRCSGYHSGACA